MKKEFENWWPWVESYYVNVNKEDARKIFEAGFVTGLDRAAKVGKGHPRKLQPMGSGGLLAEQQFCFSKGWREGRSLLRRAIRELSGEYHG